MGSPGRHVRSPRHSFQGSYATPHVLQDAGACVALSTVAQIHGLV